MIFNLFGAIYKTDTVSGNETEEDFLFKDSSFKAISLFFKVKIYTILSHEKFFRNNKNDHA